MKRGCANPFRAPCGCGENVSIQPPSTVASTGFDCTKGDGLGQCHHMHAFSPHPLEQSFSANEGMHTSQRVASSSLSTSIRPEAFLAYPLQESMWSPIPLDFV